jgi:hypothetical protein
VLAGGGSPAELLVGLGVAGIDAHRLTAGMAPVAEGLEVAHASALDEASIDAGDQGRLAAHRDLSSAACLATLSGMRGPPEVVVATRTQAPAGAWLVYASSALLLSMVLLHALEICRHRARPVDAASVPPWPRGTARRMRRGSAISGSAGRATATVTCAVLWV